MWFRLFCRIFNGSGCEGRDISKGTVNAASFYHQNEVQVGKSIEFHSGKN